MAIPEWNAYTIWFARIVLIVIVIVWGVVEVLQHFTRLGVEHSTGSMSALPRFLTSDRRSPNRRYTRSTLQTHLDARPYGGAYCMVHCTTAPGSAAKGTILLVDP